MIHFNCAQCRQSLEAPDTMAGSPVDCPQCGAPLLVPLQPAVVSRPATLRLRPTDKNPPPAKKQRSSVAKTGFIVYFIGLVVFCIAMAGAFLGQDRAGLAGGISLSCIFFFVAFILAIVVLAKGETGDGLALLLLSILTIPCAFALVAMVLPFFR